MHNWHMIRLYSVMTRSLLLTSVGATSAGGVSERPANISRLGYFAVKFYPHICVKWDFSPGNMGCIFSCVIR